MRKGLNQKPHPEADFRSCFLMQLSESGVQMSAFREQPSDGRVQNAASDSSFRMRFQKAASVADNRVILKKFATIHYIIPALCVLLLAANVVGYFGKVWFPFDLASNFPVQYAALSFPPLLLLIWQRRFALALLPLLTIVVTAAKVLPLYTAPSPAQSTGEATAVKILFANVRINNSDYQRLLDLVQEEQPDIAVFTEVSPKWDRELQPLAASYPYHYSHAENNKCGKALWSRFPIEAQSEMPLPSMIVANYALMAVIDTPQGKLQIVNTHTLAPINSGEASYRNRALTATAELVHEGKLPTVLVGDLNITPWSAYWLDFLEAAGLADGRAGFGIVPTWPSDIPIAYIPIDHCLHSKDVSIASFRSTKEFGSDHLGVVCNVVLE